MKQINIWGNLYITVRATNHRLLLSNQLLLAVCPVCSQSALSLFLLVISNSCKSFLFPPSKYPPIKLKFGLKPNLVGGETRQETWCRWGLRSKQDGADVARSSQLKSNAMLGRHFDLAATNNRAQCQDKNDALLQYNMSGKCCIETHYIS